MQTDKQYIGGNEISQGMEEVIKGEKKTKKAPGEVEGWKGRVIMKKRLRNRSWRMKFNLRRNSDFLQHCHRPQWWPTDSSIWELSITSQGTCNSQGGR